MGLQSVSKVNDPLYAVNIFFAQKNIFLSSSYPVKFLLLYSGGVDSSVLFHCLLKLCFRPDQIQILHIDYGIRGEESQREVEGIKKKCQNMGIRLHQLSHSLVQIKTGSGNLQGQARKFRYHQAGVIAIREGLDYILTAHHRDDHLETFLAKLLKGQSLASLASVMHSQSENPERKRLSRGIQILRPLSSLSKSVLIDFAQKENILFFTDSSNAQGDYERNYFRQMVFPLLDKKFPAWRENLIHTAQLLRQADDLLGKAQPWIQELPPFLPLQGRGRIPGFFLSSEFEGLSRKEKEYLFHRELYRHFPERRFSREEIGAVLDKVGGKDKRLFTLSHFRGVTEVVWSRGWVAPLITFREFEDDHTVPDFRIGLQLRISHQKTFPSPFILGFSLPGEIFLHCLEHTKKKALDWITVDIPSSFHLGSGDWNVRPLGEYPKSLRVGKKTIKKHIEAKKFPAPIRSSLIGVSHNGKLLGAINLWNTLGVGGSSTNQEDRYFFSFV